MLAEIAIIAASQILIPISRITIAPVLDQFPPVTRRGSTSPDVDDSDTAAAEQYRRTPHRLCSQAWVGTVSGDTVEVLVSAAVPAAIGGIVGNRNVRIHARASASTPTRF